VHEQRVGAIAEAGEPLVVARHLVELIAVHQQVALAVGGGVQVVALDADIAEGRADVLAHGLVVVAGHEDHLHVVARALQHLLHHRVLVLRPVDAAAPHRPEVDHVAHQEQPLALVGLEELEQPPRLAGARAQVDVGEEDRAHAHGAPQRTGGV